MSDETQNLATAAPSEFKSVVLTIDAHSGQAGDKYVQKFVGSSEDLTEAVIAILQYYDMAHLLTSAATINQFQRAATEQAPAFVIRTKSNVEIILGQEAFSLLCFQAGSAMAASMMIADMAGRAIVDTEEAAGGPVPIVLMSFELGSIAPAPIAKTSRKRSK